MPSLFMNESQSKVEEFGKPWKTLSVKQKNAELGRFIERVREVEKTFPYGHVSMFFVTPLRTEKLGIDDFFDGCTYFVEAKYVGSATNPRLESKSANTLQRPILIYREKIGQTDVEACGSDICKEKCNVLREKIFNRRDQLVKTLSERLKDKNVFVYVANDLLVERYLQAWGFGIGMPWEDFDREGKINRRIEKK